MENPKPVSSLRALYRASGKSGPRTLAVDIGGTGIKSRVARSARPSVDDTRAYPRHPRMRLTRIKWWPSSASWPRARASSIACLDSRMVRGRHHVHCGKPGQGLNNFALEQKLRRALERPVRVADSADVQGLGAVSSHGVEAVALGAGIGLG